MNEIETFWDKLIHTKDGREDYLTLDEITESWSSQRFGTARTLEMLKRTRNSIKKLTRATTILSIAIIILTLFLAGAQIGWKTYAFWALFVIEAFLILFFFVPRYYVLNRLPKSITSDK